ERLYAVITVSLIKWEELPRGISDNMRWPHSSIVCSVRIISRRQGPEMGYANYVGRLEPYIFHRRKRQGSKEKNNPDDSQQFNQRESRNFFGTIRMSFPIGTAQFHRVPAFHSLNAESDPGGA